MKDVMCPSISNFNKKNEFSKLQGLQRQKMWKNVCREEQDLIDYWAKMLMKGIQICGIRSFFIERMGGNGMIYMNLDGVEASTSKCDAWEENYHGLDAVFA